MEARRSEKNMCRILIELLLVVLAFFLGRAFGFREACKIYDPVIEQSQDLINDLKSQIEQYYQDNANESHTADYYDFQA